MLRPSHSDTIVFVGPTLPLAEARALLPGARFCPPVRCGDVLALMRLRPLPARIAIIDGNFEHVAAVWHKELLFALAAGVRVHGAASMGALRAAELAAHGMIGVGRVFTDYASGALSDDDEVALVHGSAAEGHRALTDAMVNVRATLERAVTEGVVGAALAERVCAAAKQVFFQSRVLAEVVARFDDPEAHRLLAWLPGRQVNVKRADAVELLERLRDEAAPPPSPAPPAACSAFLRGLQAYVACRPMPFAADWLAAEEQIARASRLLGARYLLLRQLALARALVAAAGLGDEPDDPADARSAFSLFLRGSGLYPGYRDAPDNPASQAALGLVARLSCTWRKLERRLEARGLSLVPSAEELYGFAQRFQRERGLVTQAALDAWLTANDLRDQRAYAWFLRGWLHFTHCVDPLACDLYGITAIDVSQSWFLDTLRESGLYQEVASWRERAAAGPDDGGLQRHWALPEAERDALARACDLSGEAELARELAALTGPE